MGILGLWQSTHHELLIALLSSLLLAIGALLVGLIFGLLVALAKLGSNQRLGRLAQCYIELFRGTPALIQLFVIYFGLTAVGITFSAYQAAVIGLGLNAAAYLTEVYRAGIEAVPEGQREAAAAIGMTDRQILISVVLPQALRVVLAPIGNIAISLLKDTSVASLISAPDLMLRAQDLSAEYFMPLEMYLIAGIMYFVICFPLSMAVRQVERRHERGR